MGQVEVHVYITNFLLAACRICPKQSNSFVQCGLTTQGF